MRLNDGVYLFTTFKAKVRVDMKYMYSISDCYCIVRQHQGPVEY